MEFDRLRHTVKPYVYGGKAFLVYTKSLNIVEYFQEVVEDNCDRSLL